MSDQVAQLFGMLQQGPEPQEQAAEVDEGETIAVDSLTATPAAPVDAFATGDEAVLRQTDTQACGSVVPVAMHPSFAGLPEGPLLRVAALMDLSSGMALSSADTKARESTEAALRSLSDALAQVKHDHHATTAA